MNPLRRTQPSRGSIRRSFLSLPTLLSFALAAALIVILATTFDLDWERTWRNIRDMDPWMYALALLAYYSSFAFRGVRWRILAQNAVPNAVPTADADDDAGNANNYAGNDDGRDTDSDAGSVANNDADSAVRLPSSAWIGGLIVIGWFVNSVTWLRLGDAYRAYALADDSGATFSWSLGTVFAERVLDMITVAALVVVAVGLLAATGGLPGDWWWYIIFIALAMAAAISLAAALMKRYGANIVRIIPGRLEGAYRAFHEGTLGSFDRLPAALSLGGVGWLLEIARLYFVIAALGLDVSLALIPVVALGHAVLSTVPTPGGMGAVEPGVTGLLLIEASAADAASVVIIDRSITYASVIAVGGALFLLRQVVRAGRG